MTSGVAVYRDALPQLSGELFLTDGGLETSLIFDYGVDLPEFAAYPLLGTEEGRMLLDTYLAPYLDTARTHATGFVLETPTWRANRDWGALLSDGPDRLDALNRRAVAVAVRTREEADLVHPVVISGLVGPRGDGYVADLGLRAEEARTYHREQIETFADTEADMVSAITLSSTDEALGFVLAARDADMPAVVGFTVETDGRLPSGEVLAQAIATVDDATDAWAAYFMINCAHPTHFADALQPGTPWTQRIRALRANASTMTHAELDDAEELDSGDPEDLAARYRALRDIHPQLTILGGCCGTDSRHVAAIAAAVTA